jgi:hypothetical protein
MRCYQTIRRTPLDELTVAELGSLQLEYAMLEVRRQANEIRASKWLTRDYMDYFVGFFNGVRFGVLQTLDYWSTDYDEFQELTYRYASEVEYLSTTYLRR